MGNAMSSIFVILYRFTIPPLDSDQLGITSLNVAQAKALKLMTCCVEEFRGSATCVAGSFLLSATCRELLEALFL